MRTAAMIMDMDLKNFLSSNPCLPENPRIGCNDQDEYYEVQFQNEFQQLAITDDDERRQIEAGEAIQVTFFCLKTSS